jgi:hypothetical protein
MCTCTGLVRAPSSRAANRKTSPLLDLQQDGTLGTCCSTGTLAMCVHWRLGYGKLQSKRISPPQMLTLRASYGTEQHHRQTQEQVETHGSTSNATPAVVAVQHNGQDVTSRNAIATSLVDATMRVLLPYASAAHLRCSDDTVTRIALSAVGFTSTPTSSSRAAGSPCMRPIASFFSSYSSAGVAAPAPALDAVAEGSWSGGSVRSIGDGEA